MTKSKIATGAMSFPQGIFEESSTQQADLGALAVGPDGSCYRYCRNVATGVAGKLYDAPAVIANHTNITVVSGAVNATTVVATLGGTAATADQYAGGTLVVNDVTGQGYTYIIESNDAQTSTTGDITVYLDPETPIKEALDTTSQITLIPNLYNNIIVHATTEVGVPVGVMLTDMTTAYYGWIKTRGTVSCLQDGTVAGIGLTAAASNGTEGGLEVGDGVLSPVGTMLAAGASGEYNPVFLTID